MKSADRVADALSCLTGIVGGANGKLGTLYKGVSALPDGVATQRAIVGAAQRDPETGRQVLRLEDENGDPITTDDARFMRLGGCTVLGFITTGDPTGLLREFISYERELLREAEKALRFYVKDPRPIRSARFSGCGKHNEETNICTQLTAEVFEDGPDQFTNAWFRLGSSSTDPDTLLTDTVLPGVVRAEVELRFGGRTLYFTDVNYSSLSEGGYISLKRLNAVDYGEIKDIIRTGEMEVVIYLKDVSFGDLFSGPFDLFGSTTYSGAIELEATSDEGSPQRPPTPTLRASSNPESVTLTVTGGEYEEVRLYRSLEGDFEVSDSTLLTTLDGPTIYEDRSLEAGRQYYYRAVGVTEAGPSVNPSAVVAGMLDIDFRLINLPPRPVQATPDEPIPLSGRFETINGVPVSSAQVSVTVPDLGWSFPLVQTDADGSFTIDFRAPVVPGSYTILVAAQGDGAARTRSVLIDVQPDPRLTRDLAITAGEISERKPAPGGEVTVEVDVANRGEDTEGDATVTAKLIAVDGTLISEIETDTISPSLEPGESIRLDTLALAVPTTTPEGAYEIRVEASRQGGEKRLDNNVFSRDVFVQNAPEVPPTYRTAQSDLQGIGAAGTVAGVTVEIADATPSSVQFEVDGDLTDALVPDEDSVVYWISENADRLLILDDYSWSDTSVTIQAGAPTDDARLIPARLLGKPGLVATAEVQVPQSSELDLSSMEYAFGNDLSTLTAWDNAEDDLLFSDWTAGLKHRLQSPVQFEDYQASLRWQTTGGDVFYQRAVVRPVPLHDIAVQNMTVVNTLESEGSALPDFFLGAPLSVGGKIVNEGDYDEKVQVEVALTEEGTEQAVYIQRSAPLSLSGRSNPNTTDGEERPFTFRIPTLGLKAAPYEITVRVTDSNDSDPNDNVLTRTITITPPPQLNVSIAESAGPFSVGDRIPVEATVGRQDISFSDASARAVVTLPTGARDEIELSYHPESGSYRGGFTANYGGNYHLLMRAERWPYQPGLSEGLRQTIVQVQPQLRNSATGITESRTLSVKASNVAGLYGASVDLTYDPTVLKYVQGDVSTRVRREADGPVTFLENERYGRVVTGFSLLEPGAGGVHAAEGLILLRAAFGGKSEGFSEIDLDNVRLVDSTGTAMAIQTVSPAPGLQVDEGLVRIEIASRDTLAAGTVGDTLDVFLSGAGRVKTVESTVSFPTDLIRITGVLKGPGLSRDGRRTLLTSQVDDQAGTVQFAVTRTGETGIDVPSERIASIAYQPISNGNAEIGLTGSKVLSDFENLALTHDAKGSSFLIEEGADSGGGLTPRIGVTPSEVSVAQEDTFDVAFTAEGLRNVYAVNTRLTFIPGAVEFLGAQKGGALTSGGNVETALAAHNGPGFVEIGLTRLGVDEGATIEARDTLYTMSFRRTGQVATSIGIESFDLLRPDTGNTIDIPPPSEILLSSSEAAPETILAVGPGAVGVLPSDLFELAVTVDNVDDLYSVAGDLAYDPEALTLQSLEEGAALQQNGASTSFTFAIDQAAGTAVVGLSQLGNASGVDITAPDTLFMATFRRETSEEATIKLVNTGLLQPDGTTEISHGTEHTNVLTPRAISISGAQAAVPTFTPSIEPGTGGNPLGVLLLAPEQTGAILDTMRVRIETVGASGITSLKVYASDDSIFSAADDDIAGEITTIPESFTTRQFTFSDLNIDLSSGETYIFVVAALSSSASGNVEVRLDNNRALGFLAGTVSEVNGGSGSIQSLSLSGDSVPLPVEMTSFSARWGHRDRIQLTWTTATETNNAGFYVQRRQPEHPWKELGFVQGAGTSTSSRTYQFEDSDPPFSSDSLLYRLKQVDVDGAASMSHKIVVSPRDVRHFEILDVFPNPVSNRATLRYKVPGRKRVEIVVYDVLGRRVRHVLDSRVKGRQQTSIDVSNLSSGRYLIRVRAGDNIRVAQISVVH